VTDEVEIADRGTVAFDRVLTPAAPEPRRTAVPPIYDEVTVETLPGSASAGIAPTANAAISIF
jgi:hypothetical protein